MTFLFLLSFSFSVAAAAADVALIRLHAKAQTDGGKLLLRQVADITGPDALVDKVGRHPVGPAAGFGLTRYIDGESLSLQIQDRYPGTVLVANPRTRVEVATRADTLSRQDLAMRVEAFLARQAEGPGRKWTFHWAQEPSPILLPRAPHALALDFAGRKRRGKTELALSIQSAEGHVLRTYPLHVQFTLEEPVRVASRRIARGETLGDDNTRVVLRETTHFHPGALPDAEKVLGLQAAQSIPEGRILTHNLVAWPPLVRRGQEARLVAGGAGLRIATSVICRQDGVPGQIISARHPETRRLLRARVLQNGDLEPVPGGG